MKTWKYYGRMTAPNATEPDKTEEFKYQSEAISTVAAMKSAALQLQAAMLTMNVMRVDDVVEITLRRVS